MNLIEHINRSRVLLALLCLGIFSAGCTSQPANKGLGDAIAATPAPAPIPAPVEAAIPAEQIVATVNGKPITIFEFNSHYNAILRERFYHGKPPESQEKAVRKEVLDLLIENRLLVEEAEKRELKPDMAKYGQAAATIEARYSALPEWKKDRERVLSTVREEIARQSLLDQVKKVLRDVPPPTPDEVRAYYDQKPELFTEPERLSLSVILLKVDPGASRADLEKTHEMAQAIYRRLKDGADFAELARQYSGDSSANNGGNLGYVHGGMLPEKLQERISKFQVGVVTEPIRMLEGIALYRLDERIAPVLRGFAEVEPRATELLKRDKQDQAWKEAVSRLHENAKIEITAPIASDSGKQAETIAPIENDSNKEKDVKKKDVKKKGGKKKNSKKKG